MSDFAQGDRVRVVGDAIGRGEVGTVGIPRSDPDEVDVALDDGFFWVYLADDLELVEKR